MPVLRPASFHLSGFQKISPPDAGKTSPSSTPEPVCTYMAALCPPRPADRLR
jgi:hypothetical protein